MRNYFGTDGIRGVANEFLTGELAFKCGNALSSMKNSPLVLIGRDTRTSGDMLTLSLASGLTSGGGTVFDLGIIPTAGVAYLTKALNADFGVVISASHNTPEYNGIKVFSNEGYKLSEKTESEIESKINRNNFVTFDKIGRYSQKFQMTDLYISSIVKACGENLDNMKVVIDCSNGASYKIAPQIFKRLNAEVYAISTSKAGTDINESCGSLHIEKLREEVLKRKAVAGFAYDGDADRLIAIDEKGEVVDGDKIIYMLSCFFKERGKLNGNLAVGTTHTNMGVQKALEKQGIKLLRTDIGDKYVIEEMLKSNAVVGGEQSGHIILRDYATTGDGILTSVIVAYALKVTGKSLSELSNVSLYPQTNINIKVVDKVRILNSEILAEKLEKERINLGDKGRIIVRASGTEQVIRVFSETEDKKLSEETALIIANVIKGLEK